MEPSLNEVSDTKWVSKAELEVFFLDTSAFILTSSSRYIGADAPLPPSQLVHTVVQTHRRVVLVRMVGQAHGVAWTSRVAPRRKERDS